MYEITMGYIRNFVVILFLAASVGCAPRAVQNGSSGVQGPQPVLATVNGHAITAGMLEREIQVLPPDLRQLAQTEEGKELLLDSLILRELILQEAARDGKISGRTAWVRQREQDRGGLIESYLKKQLSGRTNFQHLRERLAESARIVIPEKDGVDADDEGRLGYQQAEFLRKQLQLFHFGV